MAKLLFRISAAACRGLLGLLLVVGCGELSADEHPDDCRAGTMLEQLTEAIEQPELELSQQVVVRYGTDQRYYLMIRGWLNQRLQGLENRNDVGADPVDEAQQQRQSRITALRSLIRRIDLE